MTKSVTLKKKAFQGAKTAAKRGNLFGEKTISYLSTLDFDEILRYLEEHGFSRQVDQSYLQFQGFYLVEKVLNDYLSAIYASVFKYCDQNTRGLLERYYLKYQVHNTMVLIRCRQAGEQDISPYLIGEERRKEKFLKANEMPSVEESLDYISSKLGIDAAKVKETYKNGLFDLENYLYRWYYERLFSVKVTYNHQDERRFFRYLRRYVDFLNARTYLRLHEESNEALNFDSLYISGGNLGEEFFKGYDTSSMNDAFEAIAQELGIDTGDTSHTPIALIDKAISHHKQEASGYLGRLPFGSPFSHLRYLFEVEREISKLRVLLKGKWMQLSQEEIHELIGEDISRESEQVRI